MDKKQLQAFLLGFDTGTNWLSQIFLLPVTIFYVSLYYIIIYKSSKVH